MYSYPQTLTNAERRAMPALLRGWPLSSDVAPPQKLLVPVDGSPESLRAVEHAAQSAARTGSSIHLLNVQPQIMAGEITLFTTAKMVADARMDAAVAALRPARSLLERRGIPHTTEVGWGAPADEIARVAASAQCTKVVMGTRSRGLLRGLFDRSVAKQVLQRAAVPVTLVKEQGTARRALAWCVKCMFGRWMRADRDVCACSA